MADQPQLVVTPDNDSQAYDLPDHAADQVSQDFGKQKGFGGEQSAVIFQRPDGKYVPSNSVMQGNASFAMRARMPKGYKLAGIVHSHPGQDDLGQVFSPDDVNVADQLKVPSFIRFLKDGSIRKYVPGKTATYEYQSDGDRFSRGKVTKGDPLALPAPQTDSLQTAGVIQRNDPVTQY